MIQASELPASAKNLIYRPRGRHVFIFYQISTRRTILEEQLFQRCNCPTENVRSYLDMVMSPLVCNLKTRVKDTNHALQIFRTFQFAHDDARQRFLYTMDIESLYTVIPHNSGLEALKYFLNKRLAELVLTLNAFSFYNEFYHQVGGVAMGTKVRVFFCRIHRRTNRSTVHWYSTSVTQQIHRRCGGNRVL